MLKMKTSSTLGEKLEEYYEYKRYNGCCEKTLKTYHNLLGVCFKNVNKDTPIEDINWTNIIEIVNNSKIAPYTKVSYLSSLRIFMKWLDLGIIIPKIKNVKTVKSTYTDEELKKLLAKPKTNSFAEYRTYCIILMVCDNGLRAKSIREIRIEDIDLNQCIVNIRHTKTGKVQVLPFSSTTRNALRIYLKSRGGSSKEYLFCDCYGNQLSENALRLAVARYNRSRGVSRTSIHELRHTFARNWLVKCNGNVLSLQHILGHETLAMSQHYAQLFDSDILKNYKSPVESLQIFRIRNVDRG